MIYLDNASTTKIAPEVLDAMMPYLNEQYGNAGSIYKLGRDAMAAVSHAREQVSALFNCRPDQVVFTSGGSESNNTVFKGIRDRLKSAGKTHLVISSIEHDSVLRAAEMLTKDGFYITFVAPDRDGRISPRAVESAIKGNTGLVSVMFVNNETGAVNDIKEIGDICRQNDILFHTDCVQGAGQFLIDVNRCCVDFASVSSHKIHGPKGVGALYVKNNEFVPLINGGSDQEFGLRGGTENVAGIVGFGKAAEITINNLHNDMIQISMLKQKFYMALRDAFDALGIDFGIVHINGGTVVSPGKILNLRIDGVDAETMLLMLDEDGICMSAGSACRSHEVEPSYVLTAMGLTKDEARSSFRVSFSKFNRQDELVDAANSIAFCVKALREEFRDEEIV